MWIALVEVTFNVQTTCLALPPLLLSKWEFCITISKISELSEDLNVSPTDLNTISAPKSPNQFLESCLFFFFSLHVFLSYIVLPKEREN